MTTTTTPAKLDDILTALAAQHAARQDKENAEYEQRQRADVTQAIAVFKNAVHLVLGEELADALSISYEAAPGGFRTGTFEVHGTTFTLLHRKSYDNSFTLLLPADQRYGGCFDYDFHTASDSLNEQSRQAFCWRIVEHLEKLRSGEVRLPQPEPEEGEGFAPLNLATTPLGPYSVHVCSTATEMDLALNRTYAGGDDIVTMRLPETVDGVYHFVSRDPQWKRGDR